MTRSLGAVPLVLRSTARGRPDFRARLGQAAGSAAEALRASGPIVTVHVGPASQVEARVRSEGGRPAGAVAVQALIDTGASITAINVSRGTEIGLLQTGVAQIGGVGGLSQQPVFAAALHFDDPFITYDPIEIVGANMGGSGFDVLIGRNILCQMILTYDGRSGTFKLDRPGAGA